MWWWVDRVVVVCGSCGVVVVGGWIHFGKWRNWRGLVVVYIDAGGRVFAVPDDDGVTQDCFGNVWYSVSRGSLLLYGGCSAIVAGG